MQSGLDGRRGGDTKRMTEHQAQYDAVYQAIQEVLRIGYGEVVIVIANGKVDVIRKVTSEKVTDS